MKYAAIRVLVIRYCNKVGLVDGLYVGSCAKDKLRCAIKVKTLQMSPRKDILERQMMSASFPFSTVVLPANKLLSCNPVC